MAVKSAALKNEGLAAPLLGAKGAIRQKKAPSRTAPHQKGQPPRWGCGGGGNQRNRRLSVRNTGGVPGVARSAGMSIRGKEAPAPSPSVCGESCVIANIEPPSLVAP